MAIIKITFMTNGKDFTFMWINLREIFVNNENVSKEIQQVSSSLDFEGLLSECNLIISFESLLLISKEIISH